MTRSIPQALALKLQLAAIAGSEPPTSYLELRFRHTSGGMGQEFVPIPQVDRAARVALNRGQLGDVYLGVAPRTRRSGKADAVERVWCLWADCDHEDAVERIRQFRPHPSIVVRSGSNGNLHAYWPLRSSLRPTCAKVGNLRLAHVLGADRAATDVARVLRPIGTLNHKYANRRVECVRLELDVFNASDVVGGLDDDPAIVPRPRPSPTLSAGSSAAAIEGAARIVRNAHPGERNNCLNWAAYKLGQKVASGSISRVDAWAQLRLAAVDVGMTEREAERTIRSGLDAAGASG